MSSGQRIERAAKAGGYSSPEEFAQHVLEKYVPPSDRHRDKRRGLKKLKGLGYIE
jgi:hypothetical protein